MRVGIVGLGLRASHVLTQLKGKMDELEVMGYVDPDPCGLVHLSEVVTPRRQYPDVEAMLGDAPDLLFVASPNYMHLGHIRAGLEAGVRVFAEKPIVATVDETFELAKLLESHGASQVMVGLVLRYSRHMRDLRSAQEDGLIGEIVSLEANEHIAPYHGAFFMRDWRRKSEYSGGFMLEKCCHDLDVYNMVTGSRPKRVASFGGRRSFVPANAPSQGEGMDVYLEKKSFWEGASDPFTNDGDIVDHQVAILEYESGASAAFHTNVNVPDEQRRFCVVGTKGMAEGDFVRGDLKITDAHTRKLLREHDYSGTESSGVHYGADEMMAEDLAAYLREKTDSLPVSVVDCMEAGLVAMALDRARITGEVVDLEGQWSELDEHNLRD